jgi:hypothetical protein
MRVDLPIDKKLRDIIMGVKFHSRSSIAKIVTKAVTQFCNAYMEDNNIRVNEAGHVEKIEKQESQQDVIDTTGTSENDGNSKEASTV